jgi:hypothetical protein
MSALTRSNLSRRRDERCERVAAQHQPEAVFVPTEEQALVIDRAGAVLKTTSSVYKLPDLYALDLQQHRGGQHG